VYSEAVTQKHIEKIETSLDLKLHRYTVAESHELTAYLSKLNDEQKLYDANGRCRSREHAGFIRNERLLFQQDFYYALRYMKIIKDGLTLRQ